MCILLLLWGTTVAQEAQTPTQFFPPSPMRGLGMESSREKERLGSIMQWRQKSFLVGGAVVFDWNILLQMRKVDLDLLVRCWQVTIKQLCCQNTKCLAITRTRHNSFFYVPHWPPVNFTRPFSKIPRSLEPSKVWSFHSFLAYCFWLWEATPLYLVPQCMI